MAVNNADGALISESARVLPEWLIYLRIELAYGVKLINTNSDKWVLVQKGESLGFRLPPGKLPAVFSMLSDRGLVFADLWPLLDGMTGPLSVREQLMRLWQRGLLEETLHIDNRIKVVLKAAGRSPLFPEMIAPEQKFVLSDDVFIRKERQYFILDSIEQSGIVEFRDPKLLQIPLALAQPVECAELLRHTGMPQQVVIPLLNWLIWTGAARQAGVVEPLRREADTWAFADRLLHARSRLGRHLGGYGGTYRFVGKMSPPPAVRPAFAESRISLPVPDLQRIESRDKTLMCVLEQRHSVREHGIKPISVDELGEFLHRAARITRHSHNGAKKYVKRPFPSAGGLYEIEFYPLVNKCEGLTSGLYRYDGDTHSLEFVSDPSRHTQDMLENGIQSAAFKGQPHLLIVLAARFLPVNWKYESIAYSLILKNVGVIYQTMYLVATAMGLAACALGGGSGVSFGRATGLGNWDEGAVGEFLLGSSPEEGFDKNKEA